MTEFTHVQANIPSEKEIDLVAVLITMARQKKWIIGCTVGCSAVALTASLLMPPIFTATSKIMPPQQQNSSITSMLLGQLGSMAGAAGAVAGLKNPNDLYVGMLQSQTVADHLIKRFNLMQRYETKTLVDTRTKLSKISSIESGKDGLISVSVDDNDPKFAALLANAYVEELTQLTQRLAVTDASKRRLFYDQQLKNVKDQLANAEVALKKTQEKTGLLQPDGQIQAIIARAAQLRASIASKEVQLTAMRSFATQQNPDYQRIEQEVQGLKEQLAKLEQKQPVAGNIMVPTGDIPETGLEYIRRLRDVKYNETMFELIAKQYESAKLDEASDAAVIQVLDVATVPDKKSKPKRALICLFGFIAGLFLGILGAFARESYNASRNNDQEGRWKMLSTAWHNAKS